MKSTVLIPTIINPFEKSILIEISIESLKRDTVNFAKGKNLPEHEYMFYPLKKHNLCNLGCGVLKILESPSINFTPSKNIELHCTAAIPTFKVVGHSADLGLAIRLLLPTNINSSKPVVVIASGILETECDAIVGKEVVRVKAVDKLPEKINLLLEKQREWEDKKVLFFVPKYYLVEHGKDINGKPFFVEYPIENLKVFTDQFHKNVEIIPIDTLSDVIKELNFLQPIVDISIIKKLATVFIFVVLLMKILMFNTNTENRSIPKTMGNEDAHRHLLIDELHKVNKEIYNPSLINEEEKILILSGEDLDDALRKNAKRVFEKHTKDILELTEKIRNNSLCNFNYSDVEEVNSFLTLGQYETAIEKIKNIRCSTNKEESDRFKNFILSNLYFIIYRYNDAIKTFNKSYKDKKNFKLSDHSHLHNICRINNRLKYYSKVINIIDDNILNTRKYSKDWHHYVNIKSEAFIGLNEPKKAIEILDKAIESPIDKETIDIKAEHLRLKGVALLAAGDFENAYKQFSEAKDNITYKTEPCTTAKIYVGMGDYDYKLKKFDDAHSDYINAYEKYEKDCSFSEKMEIQLKKADALYNLPARESKNKSQSMDKPKEVIDHAIKDLYKAIDKAFKAGQDDNPIVVFEKHSILDRTRTAKEKFSTEEINRNDFSSPFYKQAISNAIVEFEKDLSNSNGTDITNIRELGNKTKALNIKINRLKSLENKIIDSEAKIQALEAEIARLKALESQIMDLEKLKALNSPRGG